MYNITSTNPVLPSKVNNKLMFVLCKTCGEILNQNNCKHNDEERVFTGTWVIDGVKKAMENRYKLLKVFEVWKCRDEHYNLEKSANLFSDYITSFLKIIQQASGCPTDYDTEEKKVYYLKEYVEKKDVTFDTEKKCDPSHF